MSGPVFSIPVELNDRSSLFFGVNRGYLPRLKDDAVGALHGNFFEGEVKIFGCRINICMRLVKNVITGRVRQQSANEKRDLKIFC